MSLSNPTRRTFLRAGTAAALSSCAIAKCFAANQDEPALKIALLSGSAEYHSDDSLTAFADDLEKTHRIQSTKIFAKDGAGDPIPNLEAIDTTDLLILFTRRLKPPKDQLDRFKK